MPYVWNSPCVGIAPTVWCHFWQLTVWNREIVSMEVFLKYSAKVATIKADAQYLEGAQAQLKDQSLPLAEILWGEGKNSVVDSEQRDEEQGGARQTPVNTQHTQRRFRRLIKSLNMLTHSNCNALEIKGKKASLIYLLFLLDSRRANRDLLRCFSDFSWATDPNNLTCVSSLDFQKRFQLCLAVHYRNNKVCN